MVKPRKDITKRPIRRRVLVLIVFLLLLYVVVPQIDSFKESFVQLKHVDRWPTLGAAVAVIISYGVAAGTYQQLALHRLHWQRTLLVQGASAFANRILPAGLGGLTLNVQYLRGAGHTTPQAIAVAGANNALGFIGHLLILLAALVIAGPDLLQGIDLGHAAKNWYLLAVAAGAVGIVLFVAGGLRRMVFRLLGNIIRQLLTYRKRPLRLAGAVACSLTLTLLYVAAFYWSAIAVGADIRIFQALLVFSAGIVLGTVTPTPGGLGGVEAGLVAGLVACDIEPATALAVALLYRLLTYWLPLIPGFVLFMATHSYYHKA